VQRRSVWQPMEPIPARAYMLSLHRFMRMRHAPRRTNISGSHAEPRRASRAMPARSFLMRSLPVLLSLFSLCLLCLLSPLSPLSPPLSSLLSPLSPPSPLSPLSPLSSLALSSSRSSSLPLMQPLTRPHAACLALSSSHAASAARSAAASRASNAARAARASCSAPVAVPPSSTIAADSR